MFFTSSFSKFLLISFFLLILSYSSFDNLHSQVTVPNPDSIPFAPAVSYRTGDYPQSVFCADLGGDLQSGLNCD